MTSRILATVTLGLFFACNQPAGADPAAAKGSAAPPTTAPAKVPPSKTPAPGAGSPTDSPAAKPVSVEQVLVFVKDRKRLQTLTPQSAPKELGWLAPNLKDTGDRDPTWDLTHESKAGLVRKVAVSFAASNTGKWPFNQLVVFMAPEDKAKALEDIQQSLKATLKRPKWKKSAKAGWNLGDGWELVVAEEDGQIVLTVYEPTAD